MAAIEKKETEFVKIVRQTAINGKTARIDSVIECSLRDAKILKAYGHAVETSETKENWVQAEKLKTVKAKE